MKTNQSQKNNSGNWQLRRLDSMFTVRRGGSPRPIENYITNREDGLNWLKIGDIDVGAKYITSTSSKILKEGLSRTTLVKKGDFILSNSMSFGRPYIMDIDACIHDGWLTFQDIKTHILDRDFLYYLLSQSKTQSIFVSISAGSGVQNLKKETVSEVELSIPSLVEQNRIVSILETWDKTIEKLSKKIEVKKQIKKGLMQDLLTGKKRLKGFNDKWELIKLKTICNIQKGKQLNKENMIENGIYPVLNGGIEISGWTNEWNTKENTITISEGGNSCGYINFNKNKFWCGGHCYAVIPTKNIDNLFLYQVLKIRQDKIMMLRVGSGLPNIQKKSLDDLKVLFPQSKEEQEEISRILNTADNEIQELEKKLQIIKDQKKYLLNNLITGTIRTPETLSTKLIK